MPASLPSQKYPYMKVGSVILFLLSMSYGCWLLFKRMETVAPDYGEAENSLSRPSMPVSIDLTNFPVRPNEQHFAELAQSVMERETHLQGFQVYLISWNVACDVDLYKPSFVQVAGQWLGEVDATQMRVVSVQIRFEEHMNSMSIDDSSANKSLFHPPAFINWSAVQYHIDDVFDVIEEQGGKGYRQEMQNDCQIKFYLDNEQKTFLNNEWLVVYSPGSLEKLGFCARVDSLTGAYTTGRVEKSGDGCGSALIAQP